MFNIYQLSLKDGASRFVKTGGDLEKARAVIEDMRLSYVAAVGDVEGVISLDTPNAWATAASVFYIKEERAGKL